MSFKNDLSTAMLLGANRIMLEEKSVGEITCPWESYPVTAAGRQIDPFRPLEPCFALAEVARSRSIFKKSEMSFERSWPVRPIVNRAKVD
jgi:hypothetical protein